MGQYKMKVYLNATTSIGDYNWAIKALFILGLGACGP
jgi:hypothetical protein